MSWCHTKDTLMDDHCSLQGCRTYHGPKDYEHCPSFSKSLPKVLARISNVWVHMWGIMQLEFFKNPTLSPIKHVSWFFCWTYSAVSHGWLRRQVRDIITNLFGHRISTPTVNLFKLSLFFSLAFKLPNLIIQSGYLINYHQYHKFTN